MKSRSGLLVPLAGALVALAAAGCGGEPRPADPAASTSATAGTTSVTTSSPVERVTVTATPEASAAEPSAEAAPQSGNGDHGDGAVDRKNDGTDIAYCEGHGDGIAILENGLAARRIECVDQARVSATGSQPPFQPTWTAATQPSSVE